MQLAILATLALGAAAADILGSQRAVSLTAAVKDLTPSVRHVRARHHRESAHFGDTRCPCIGFDNIDGETTVVFQSEDGQENAVAYPADLGARCEPWDNGRHADCKEGQTPGFGNGWCGQPWCYVDPCNCKIPVLPKLSSYSPDALYRGKPLFFSYATCGGKDMWTKGIPEVGTPGCRCIGFDNVPGTTEMKVGKNMVEYPAEVGGSCQAWDMERHPECKGDKQPKWCHQAWCYVDPCSCGLPQDTPPKISMYLPEATFTGKGIYYSYETCGAKDYFTESMHLKACVNQEDEDSCNKLSRCAWTGRKCLGAELVDHPLCKGLVHGEEEAKSSAAVLRPLAAAAATALAAAASLC